MVKLQLPTQKLEFFWTVRRRRYWRSCRRKYFLYYYAAQGGFDLYAPRTVRQFYAAKKVIPLAEYVRRLVNLAIRESFYAPFEEELPESFPELFPIAARRAEWEFHRMLAGENPFLLLELLQPETPPAEIHREMMAKLDAFCAGMTQGAWSFLSRIPHCDRRPIDSPLALSVAELKCFLVPLVAVRRAGEIWLIEGTGTADAGNEIATLGKFAAAQLWRMPPQCVKSFILAGDNGVFTEIGTSLDVSEVLRGIRQDVEEMTSLIRDDGSVCENDFPADTSHCENCAFRFFCRK